MRKIIAVFLSILFITGTFGICTVTAANASDLSFAVASDLHYNAPVSALSENNSVPLYFHATSNGALKNESGYIIDSFLNQCAADDGLDFVLISGDLADNGKTDKSEHEAVAAKLSAFEESTGKSVFVINGNHDFSADGDTTPDLFREIYADFGYNEALVKDTLTCSYTADLGSKYRLIALDSFDLADPTMDGLCEDRINWVKAQAVSAVKDGKQPILMMHHTVLSHMPLARVLGPAMHGGFQSVLNQLNVFSEDYNAKYKTLAAETFADCGIKIILSGHEHMSDATSYTSLTGNIIYDFTTTSLSMYPLEYRVFDLTDEDIIYTEKQIEGIDTSALTQNTSGYTAEQIAAIGSDINAYSKGFFKTGLGGRLKSALTAEQFGIDSSNQYYTLINDALLSVSNVLSLPLYGEGGADELALTYGITLPQTDYIDGWDLVLELLASFYSGTEDRTPESADVKLLLNLVCIALREAGQSISDSTYLAAADSLFAAYGISDENGELTSLGKFAYGEVTPVEEFAIALMSPVIYGFTYDDDGIDDNNGTLPNFASTTLAGNINNSVVNMQSLITKIVQYFKLIIGFFANIKSYV